MPTEENFWRRYDAMEMRLTAPVSERMLDLAGVATGMRVLDLATGRGEPALRAAQRVGANGSVVGIDSSSAVLQIASERAAENAITNLDLHVANADSPFDVPAHSFDVVTARWGLMYMRNPVAALENARFALTSTGVLVAALWAEPERVPYFTLPRELLSRYRSIPPIDSAVPGTFRFADVARIKFDFAAAGLTVVHIEEMEIPVVEGTAASELVAWVRGLGVAQLLQELAPEQQQAWERDLTDALEALRTDSLIRLGGVTRIVLARP